MSDIREILNSLDPEDKKLWSQHRTEMRRSFITAHNSVLGLAGWSESDDMMLDYIDIALALLFDRAGRMESTKPPVEQDKTAIEAKIAEAEDVMKSVRKHELGQATVALKANGGWN